MSSPASAMKSSVACFRLKELEDVAEETKGCFQRLVRGDGEEGSSDKYFCGRSLSEEVEEPHGGCF